VVLQHNGLVVYIGKADDSAKSSVGEASADKLQGRIGNLHQARFQLSFAFHFAHTWEHFNPNSHMIFSLFTKLEFSRDLALTIQEERRRQGPSLQITHWLSFIPVDP